jgi:hypothetical protein
MPSIGETLREARMRQRHDITDVEAATKIRAKYLRALENEDFGMLPGPTFVKSFLRTYAEFLGLDPHLLVEEYRVMHDPRDESELTPFAPRPRGRDRRPPPPRWGRPLLAAAALIVLVLGLLLILGLTSDSDKDKTASTTTATTTTAKKKKPAAKPAAKKRKRRVPRTVSLRIVPAGDTYACIDRGPGTDVIYEGTLTGPRTFKGKRVRINLGRRAVTLTANGHRIKVPAGSDPFGMDLRPRTRRLIPSGQRPCA